MKKEIIALFCMFLIITSSISGYAQVDDFGTLSLEDLEEGEDILINIEDYQPKVVPSQAFETDDYIGYPVYALLTGIKTNPLIEIPRIRSVTPIRIESNVKGIGVSYRAPPYGFTLENMGYLIIRLPRIKDERKIPRQVDINITARILYEVGRGFGVYEQDLTLPQLTENEFLPNKEEYSFWSGRGFLRADEIKDNSVRFAVYDGRNEQVASVTLSPGQESREIFLYSGYLLPGIGDQFLKRNIRDRFKIKLNEISVPKDLAKIEMLINGEFKTKDLAEGQQIYPGSDWRIKSISKTANTDIVNLFNEKESKSAKLTGTSLFTTTFKCSDFDNRKDECDLLSNCEYKDNKCVDKTQATAQPGTQQEPSKLVEEVRNLYQDNLANSASLNENSKFEDIKQVIDNFVNIINKYALDKDSSIQLYVKLTSGSLVDIYNKYYNNENVLKYLLEKYPGLQIKAEITGEQPAQLRTSKEYYEKAIEAYQKVIAAAPQPTQEKDYAKDAQKEIAKIYDLYLRDNQKAIEAYRDLINNFDLNELEKIDAEQRIKLLELRKNYDTKSETIFEDGNSISLILLGIKQAVIKPEATILEQGNLRKVKIGDIVNNWIITSIEFNRITLRSPQPTQSGQYTTKTLFLDKDEEVNGALVKLINVDTKRIAYVTILPGKDFLTSTTNFKLHIPVEPRLFKLSDEQIDKQIANTQEFIEKLDNVIDKVEKLYRGFFYTCTAIFIILSAKNFFEGFGGKQLARKINVDKWEVACKSGEIKDDKGNSYKSVTKCMEDHVKDIDADTGKVADIIDKVKGNNYKDLDEYKKLKADGYVVTEKKDDKEIIVNEEEVRGVLRANLLAKTKFSLSGVQREYLNDYVDQQINLGINKEFLVKLEEKRKKFYDANNNFKEFSNLNPDIIKELNINQGDWDGKSDTKRLQIVQDYLNNKKVSLQTEAINSLTKVEKYNELLELNKNPAIKNELSNVLNNKRKSLLLDIEKLDISKLGFIDPNKVNVEKQRIIFESNVWKYNGENLIHPIYILISDENKNVTQRITLQGYLESKGLANKKVDLLNLQNELEKNEKLTILTEKGFQEVDVIDAVQERVEHIKKVNVEESGRWQGRLKRISVDAFHYTEVDERSGDGRITEISLWKRQNPNSLMGSNTDIPVIRKVGIGQCRTLTNYVTKESITGISEACGKLTTLDAELARADKKVGNKIRDYLIDNAIQEGGGLQCYSLMSAVDCKILFAACDPVMCPPSRFKTDSYQVNNVVATGLFGSIFLGQDLWSTPEIGICIPGVLAALKNYRSLAQGFEQCLAVKKEKGENVGICDMIRNVGVCRVVWREAAALLRLDGGLFGVLSRKVFDVGEGGGEYAFFAQNLKRTSDFLEFFTNEYATTYFNAYRGGSIEEIGDNVCEAAIFGKLPGTGSFIDQLTRPQGPPQFTAIIDEYPHADVGGIEISDYTVYYHIYAGEDFQQVKYYVYLRDIDGNLGTLTIAPRFGSARGTGYLNRGDFIDDTVRTTERTGYDEVCIVINNQHNCGFGKVSSGLAVTYFQDRLTAEQIKNVNITSESECTPDKTIVGSARQGALSATTGVFGAVSSGISATGVVRKCSIKNPGKGVNEARWDPVGTCGKDELKRDLGSCWLDKNSLNLVKDKELRSELGEFIENLNKQLIEDEQFNNEFDKLNNKKEQFLNEIRTYTTYLGNYEDDLINENIRVFNKESLDLINLYEELAKKTINPLSLAKVYTNEGEIYLSLANLYRAKEIKQFEALKEKIEAEKKAEIPLCVIEYEEDNNPLNIFDPPSTENFYYRFNNGIWELNTKANSKTADKWLPITIENCGRIHSTFETDITPDPIYKEICLTLAREDNDFNAGAASLALITSKEGNEDDFLIIHPPNKKGVAIPHGQANFEKIKTICESKEEQKVIEGDKVAEVGLPIEVRIGLYKYFGDNFLGDWMVTDHVYKWDGKKWSGGERGGEIEKYAKSTSYEDGLDYIKDKVSQVERLGSFREVKLNCRDKQKIIATKFNLFAVDVKSELDRNIKTLCVGLPVISDEKIKEINLISSNIDFRYGQIIQEASDKFDVDKDLIKAVIYAESIGDPRAVSYCGAMGLMQLLPETAEELGLHVPPYTKSEEINCCDEYDTNGQCIKGKIISGCRRGKESNCRFEGDQRANPELNIKAGSRLLARLIEKYNGDKRLALAEYNGGSKANVASEKCPGKLAWECKLNLGYKETRDYVENVLKYEQQFLI